MYYCIYDPITHKYYRPHGKYGTRWGDTPMLYATMGNARNALGNAKIWFNRDHDIKIMEVSLVFGEGEVKCERGLGNEG